MSPQEASTQGWAHYVSAFAFNLPNHFTPCRIEPNSVIYWNYDSFSTNEAFSCEGADVGGDTTGAEHTLPPVAVVGRDVYGQWCDSGPYQHDNRGIEYDWMRFWWDFNKANGFGFKKATDVIVEMGSDDWCAEDFTPQGGVCTTDLPRERLEDAMSTLGWSTLYNSIKDNGVDR